MNFTKGLNKSCLSVVCVVVVSTKRHHVCEGSNNLFLIQGIMIRAGFGPVNPQILSFKTQPGRLWNSYLEMRFLDLLMNCYFSCGKSTRNGLSGKILNIFAALFYTNPRITELQKSEIRRAVRVEDLHRASDLGISAMSGNANHTNDEADMEVKHGEAFFYLRQTAG